MCIRDRYRRGCYSCFGPSESANVASIVKRYRDMLDEESIVRLFRTFNAYAESFREVERVES